jgi:hypothetical protein
MRGHYKREFSELLPTTLERLQIMAPLEDDGLAPTLETTF